jgi:hypothetical protein
MSKRNAKVMEDRMTRQSRLSDDTPKYWPNETSGKLQGPMTRYIGNQSLSADDILCIRAYLRQWIDSPAWDLNPAADNESRLELATLRTTARQIKSRQEINEWIAIATKLGMDPL